MFIMSASTATEVILTLLFTLISGALIFLLIKSIKRENKKYAVLTNKHLTININELKTLITRETSKQGREFALLEMTFSNAENIERVCGQEQYESALDETFKKIRQNFSPNAKISVIEKDKLWIFAKGKFKKEALRLVLQKLINIINEPIVLAGALNIEFDVNIAAIVYERTMGDINAISANLQLTTIAAKKRGNNIPLIFDRTITNVSSEQYTLFMEIQDAIKQKDFRIFYQPIVDSLTLECVSLEAFLRWEHKEKGIISPDVFMPSLEHSGDINWVGLWAFEEIAKQLDYWHTHNPDVNIKANVNWSMSQLSNPKLFDEIRKILKKYKVAGSDFYFEITNYSATISMDSAAKNIDSLRQIGVGIAIDNISLEVETIMGLQAGTVKMMKFNKDFIKRIEKGNEAAKSIAEMIVKTANANDILIAGEGVETDEILQKFISMGIHLAQGYLFSKPKPPGEVMADILMTPWKN